MGSQFFVEESRMREFVIENGIVIDDVDSVVEGIRSITGKSLSDMQD